MIDGKQQRVGRKEAQKQASALARLVGFYGYLLLGIVVLAGGVRLQGATADAAKAVPDRGIPFNQCGAAGHSWELSFDNQKSALVCVRLGGPLVQLSIPVTFDDTGLAASLVPFSQCRDYYHRMKAGGWVTLRATPDGVLFFFGPVYYWLPKEKVEAIITQMMSAGAPKKETVR